MKKCFQISSLNLLCCNCQPLVHVLLCSKREMVLSLFGMAALQVAFPSALYSPRVWPWPAEVVAKWGERHVFLCSSLGLSCSCLPFSEQRDRGSTTSLSSDFSLGVESSPGVVGSFTYEAVELMPAGAQAQAAW